MKTYYTSTTNQGHLLGIKAARLLISIKYLTGCGLTNPDFALNYAEINTA